MVWHVEQVVDIEGLLAHMRTEWDEDRDKADQQAKGMPHWASREVLPCTKTKNKIVDLADFRMIGKKVRGKNSHVFENFNARTSCRGVSILQREPGPQNHSTAPSFQSPE